MPLEGISHRIKDTDMVKTHLWNRTELHHSNSKDQVTHKNNFSHNTHLLLEHQLILQDIIHKTNMGHHRSINSMEHLRMVRSLHSMELNHLKILILLSMVLNHLRMVSSLHSTDLYLNMEHSHQFQEVAIHNNHKYQVQVHKFRKVQLLLSL